MFSEILHKIQALKEHGLYRVRKVASSPCAPNVVLGERQMLAFNSNDYLGLANDQRLIEAFKEGVSLYGVGSGASHLISGHSKAHALLEDRLTEFMSPYIRSAKALYFCTGYMANLAVITALVDVNKDSCEVFSEALNHASIIDAIRLSRATCSVYGHCDHVRLKELLLTSKASNKIVVSDGVFSMDGDIAPLLDLVRVCEETNAWLVIDDAHGFGVLGAGGRGILEHFNIKSTQIIYMGTLGKAGGVGGAFLCADENVIDWIVQKARSYIYTTAAPPACAHALLTSIDLIGSQEGLAKRDHLNKMIQILRKQLSLISGKWNLLESQTPIQPLVIGSNADVLQASKALENLGLWVTAIRAPTVPAGSARLRITLSAAHSTDEVMQLVNGLNKIASELVI